MRFYFLPQQQGENDRETTTATTTTDDNENPSCSYALVRTRTHLLSLVLSLSLFLRLSLSAEASCLLTQFLAFLRPLLSIVFILSCANPAALDFASTSSSAPSSYSPLPSSPPSAPSRGYVQARCIPEPREWKDLVKVSRSLGAYA